MKALHHCRKQGASAMRQTVKALRKEERWWRRRRRWRLHGRGTSYSSSGSNHGARRPLAGLSHRYCTVLDHLLLQRSSNWPCWRWPVEMLCCPTPNDPCLCCSFSLWFEGNPSEWHRAQNERWKTRISHDLPKTGEGRSDQGEIKAHRRCTLLLPKLGNCTIMCGFLAARTSSRVPVCPAD